MRSQIETFHDYIQGQAGDLLAPGNAMPSRRPAMMRWIPARLHDVMAGNTRG